MTPKSLRAAQYENSLQPFKDPEQDLFDLWLSSSELEPRELFPDTATACQIVGCAQRTIRFWIDAGLIRAVPIGKKHHVYLKSLVDYLEYRFGTWEGGATKTEMEDY